MESDNQQVSGQEIDEIATESLKQPLTFKQYKELRRVYFTVRHDIVHPCQHKLDRMNEPRNNCEYCWFHWLNSHGELVQLADRALQEQGKDFLIKMRGVKFYKMFLRFMSTIAKFKEEEKNEQTRETSSSEGSGEGTREDLRLENDCEHGGESQPDAPVNSDEPAIG